MFPKDFKKIEVYFDIKVMSYMELFLNEHIETY